MNEGTSTGERGLGRIRSTRKVRPFTERFWSKVDVRAPDECWEWQSAKNEKGYGRLTAGRGVHLKAHRVAQELVNGPIPEGMNVLHRCDNPPCCNPKHLFLGTMKDNTQDMLSKGRGSAPPTFSGEQHPCTKFDEITARKILTDKRTLHAIADEHGVSWMTIFRLKHGITWKNLQVQGVTA